MMCMDVCVLFPRSALSCMEMTNDRHPVSLLKNFFPLCSQGSVSRGLHSFPNSSQTSCLSLEPKMHTCFGGGHWQMSHHSTPQILFFKTCVCKCACTFRTLCITVLFNNFRKVGMLFNTGYEFVNFFSLDLSVVIFNCQCACTHGERGGGREMELSFINT